MIACFTLLLGFVVRLNVCFADLCLFWVVVWVGFVCWGVLFDWFN